MAIILVDRIFLAPLIARALKMFQTCHFLVFVVLSGGCGKGGFHVVHGYLLVFGNVSDSDEFMFLNLEESVSDKSLSSRKFPSESSGVSNYKLRKDIRKRNKSKSRKSKLRRKVKTLQPLLIVQKNDGEKINIKKLMKKVRLVLKGDPKKLEDQQIQESQSE